MITLCVMFNHAHPDNIPIIREILGHRFDDIIFFQPIHKSDDPNVFSSYRGSFNFQGLVADHADDILKRGSSHYVFVHDDVFLNPLINQDNIIERLGVHANGAFISDFCPAGGRINGPEYRGWPWIVGVLWKLACSTNSLSGSGLQSLERDFAALAAQPSDIEAKYGIHFAPFTYDSSSPAPLTYPFNGNALNDEINDVILRGLMGNGSDRPLTLPIATCFGFSDFFVVDAGIMERVAHMLGIFAAANVFAEVAVPSALIHVAERLVQAKDVGLRSNWSYELSTTTETLIEGFEADLLLVHPLKLSFEKNKVLEVCAALIPS